MFISFNLRRGYDIFETSSGNFKSPPERRSRQQYSNKFMSLHLQPPKAERWKGVSETSVRRFIEPKNAET